VPTPSRTSLDAIVAAGREILEARGLAGVTMQAVAQAVGVRAPSLYKHVEDREALVGLVADAAALELAERLATHDRIADLARELRAWAHAHPQAFRLAFSGRGSEEALAAAAGPVLATTRSLVGEESALDAARLVTAWATGFLSMELAGAFRLGGSVDGAFEYGLGRLTAALSR
jgi:AcrR family transcriptional regulator